MNTIQVTKLTCRRCGHTWTPRRTQIFACPRCNSPRWNREGEEASLDFAANAEVESLKKSVADQTYLYLERGKYLDTIKTHAQTLANALESVLPHINAASVRQAARAALEAARKDGAVK